MEIGQFEEWSFTGGGQGAGRTIRVVYHGERVDHDALTRLLAQIVNYETTMMGGAPFPEYTFFLHVGPNYGGGGMEHANCTAISVDDFAQLANVSAHEFFHLWNVKRIRPQTLEPVDHTREMYTRALWFAEGVTSTYAAYTLVRTGLWSHAQFLADLGKQINELESRPARAWQSAEESSLDTWLDKYSLYNRPEFSISYYNKGQLLGVALDILIRDATDNRASLDDVMRRMNREYAERGRYYDDSAGVERAVEEVVSDETVREAKPGSAPGAEPGAEPNARRSQVVRPCGKHLCGFLQALRQRHGRNALRRSAGARRAHAGDAKPRQGVRRARRAAGLLRAGSARRDRAPTAHPQRHLAGHDGRRNISAPFLPFAGRAEHVTSVHSHRTSSWR